MIMVFGIVSVLFGALFVWRANETFNTQLELIGGAFILTGVAGILLSSLIWLWAHMP